MNCPICNREMNYLDGSCDEHHLTPKTFGGKIKILIHKVCHRKIHSIFTERELLTIYNNIDKILEHDEIKKFIKWVSKKEVSFYISSKDMRRKKK